MLALALTLPFQALRAGGQDRTPVFRAQVQQVEVMVAVTDASGREVNDLGLNDFEIQEDGVPQVIASFNVVDGEAASAAAAASGSGIVGSVGDASIPGASTSQPLGRRTYVLLLDSGNNVDRMCMAAIDFIDAVVQRGDQVAVLTGETVGVWSVIQVPERLPVTEDREKLKSVVRDYCSRSLLPRELSPFTLAAIEGVAVRLRQMPGHRDAIVLFSAGTSAFWNDASRNPNRMEFSEIMRTLFESAARMATLGGIPIHVVDPSGMYPLDPSGRGRSVPDISGETSGFLYDAQLRLQRLQEVGARDQPASLHLIAEATGGAAVVNTSNFTGNYTRILNHRWPTYVMSYATAPRYDARFHRIAVQVKRPGVVVRATPGYYAFRPGGLVRAPVQPPRGLSPAAKVALSDASAATGLGVTMEPSVFMDGTRGSVLVTVDITSGVRPLDAGLPIELALAALDGDGVLRSADRKILRIKNPGPANGAPLTVTAVARLEVPAGRYRIVAVAAQPGATGSASAWRDLEVLAQPIRFSDVVLASSATDSRQVVLADEELQRELRVPPTLRRSFQRMETLTAFVKVTDGARLLRTGIVLRARLMSAAGSIVWQHSGTARSNAVQPAVGYTIAIPLQRLEPGDYQLVFDGQGVATTLSGASTGVTFSVR